MSAKYPKLLRDEEEEEKQLRNSKGHPANHRMRDVNSRELSPDGGTYTQLEASYPQLRSAWKLGEVRI